MSVYPPRHAALTASFSSGAPESTKSVAISKSDDTVVATAQIPKNFKLLAYDASSGCLYSSEGNDTFHLSLLQQCISATARNNKWRFLIQIYAFFHFNSAV
jgi:hypothetical protein